MICLKCFYFDVGRKFTDLHQVEIAASENFDEKNSIIVAFQSGQNCF